jgi:hypothetical protein
MAKVVVARIDALRPRFAFLQTREQTQGMKNLDSGRKSKGRRKMPTQFLHRPFHADLC